MNCFHLSFIRRSELWFKIVNRELRLTRPPECPQVAEETVPHVVHHLRRVNRVLELAVDHFQVMETLTPQDFLGFREDTPASGFQSSKCGKWKSSWA